MTITICLRDLAVVWHSTRKQAIIYPAVTSFSIVSDCRTILRFRALHTYACKVTFSLEQFFQLHWICNDPTRKTYNVSTYEHCSRHLIKVESVCQRGQTLLPWVLPRVLPWLGQHSLR